MWLIDVIEIDAEMAVDACLELAGGVRGDESFTVQFPERLKTPDHNITHYELWAVIIGIRLWGSQLTGKVIRIKSDNEAVATIINTGRSRDCLLQSQLRELVWWLSLYQMKVKLVHLSGKNNRLPDLLSRWMEGPQIREELNMRTKNLPLKFRQIDKRWFTFTHNW